METGSISPLGGPDPLRRYAAQKKPVAKTEKGESKGSVDSRKDSVEISDAAKSQNRVMQVRERLKKGFYDTDQVKDAVSEKLSGLFDEEQS
jgi:hypothetical protein